MKQENIIRREMPTDYAAVEHLTREAFWNVYRPGCLEHYVVHVLREDPDFVPELDLVMERDGELIGNVLYMRAKIVADDGREIPINDLWPHQYPPRPAAAGPGQISAGLLHGAGRGTGCRGPVHRRQHRLLRKVRLCGGRDERHSLSRENRNRRSFPMFC